MICRAFLPAFTLHGKQIATLLILAVMSLCAAQTVQASDGGTLLNPRYAHTATLLLDGRVLVAGGLIRADGGYLYTTKCEIYNPATNTWTATGDLNQKRFFHGSVLLPDGRVLAAGGDLTTGKTAEIYDPATGSWTPTGSMLAPRDYFDPVLLPNGKVLAAGSAGRFLACELYDPATGTWSSTGSLHQQRQYGSLTTLLLNGHVLIAGGHSTRVGYLSETEFYDPVSASWAIQGSLAFGRVDHAQVRLADGRVLVAGGLVNPPHSVQATRSTEVYDSSTRLWTSAGGLRAERFYFTANLLSDGQVFAVGGAQPLSNRIGVLGSIEQFDPATGAWQTRAETLAFPRQQHTATTLLDGSVLIAGGSGSSGELVPNAELFVRPQ